MKRFFNRRETVVADAVAGLLHSSAGASLAMLEPQDGITVVLRRERDGSKVALVSGGGSGHEPAHAGFVGRGMLTAAVCGQLFASPGVDAVLAAILAATGEAGCLLIVKNYTGDRLNFGLAAEQARALGRKVETVIVADDVALGVGAHARGVAGTVLVHKIAGHVAERGGSLEEVAAAARAAAASVRSIGLALTDVNVFDPAHETRLGDGEAELGLGIHGEPGAERIDVTDVDALTALAADRLDATLEDGPQVVLLNMLGAVPVIEGQILMAALARTRLARRMQAVIGPAPVMTALDMSGFSLTAIPARKAFLDALASPVEPSAWPGIASFGAIVTAPVPELPGTFPSKPSANPLLERLIRKGADVLIGQEQALNALDAKIGDGDAGSTFAESARMVLEHLDKLPLAEPQALFATFGRLLSRHAGGSSGVLLSILFAAAGQKADWRAGLAAGVARMQDYGGAKPGDRTMLDALIPAIDAVQAEGDAAALLSRAAQAARKGADATRAMPARAGRAAYVPEAQLRDIPDPGAEAIARLLEGMAEA
ncbi:dihydroxyacetone kinase subunit DhaK [Acidomonas methanolica]|uniref:dihydroxyacetone kinase subunit DhaK n=5 Tax=Acidomonas methanolica TaxID=437 RepID=UPI00104C0083|nr:dihydroxyacetone kinase subunit DhaK [Acidomonas methanolica]MBU2654650.1 dihydroxyacetone kinase subunit DhaK [Acidomonas methanolica]TCS27349.1 homodimeric dihydroxyacetone kinase [Acidomonas methanolica]GEK99625.1 dihydroxyacetone kinase [Acidomonas methanolica NBRC 104435]